MNHPLAQIVLARLHEFVREPASIFWVYGFPLIMTVALGLAFRDKPVDQTITVDIQENAAAASLQEMFADKDRFVTSIRTEQEWRKRLRTGNTDLVIIPVPGTDASGSDTNGDSNAKDGTPSETESIRTDGALSEFPMLQYVFDPSRPGSIVARDAVNDAVQSAAGRVDKLDVVDERFDEPGNRYIDFLIPGLLGMSLMGGGLWGVGYAITDMRIRKLLKRFVATPMKRSHFLTGIMISRMIFVIPEMIILVIFARIFFGVVIHGSIGAVILLILLGAIQFSGIGLLIASRAQTIETVSGLMNLTMLPMWIASGIFFKPENFPDFLQPFIIILPLTPLIRALRGVMLEGDTLFQLLPEVTLITGWGFFTFALALYLFRWK